MYKSNKCLNDTCNVLREINNYYYYYYSCLCLSLLSAVNVVQLSSYNYFLSDTGIAFRT